ncbi:hypothetical protein ONI91_23620, partial [Salmonella enterica subsp. enterica serovar Montevideo]|nr:hypothetical protein [Salmonella enterica subsp. enterica serovar Montevideo]
MSKLVLSMWRYRYCDAESAAIRSIQRGGLVRIAHGITTAPMPIFKNLSAYDDRSARLAGIGLMVLSIFMFSFGDAMGKFLVGTYSVGQLLFLRACAALLLLSP